MLSFAEGSEAWKRSSRRSRDMDEVWKRLLGLTPFQGSFWHAALVPAVNAIRPYFERWALKQMADAYTVRIIIYFLKTDAAEHLRLDALGWFREGVPLNDRYFWQDMVIQDAFANFLKVFYEEHWQHVVSSTSTREAFMTFALKLGALQHPLGSEILTLAGNRLGSAR